MPFSGIRALVQSALATALATLRSSRSGLREPRRAIGFAQQQSSPAPRSDERSATNPSAGVGGPGRIRPRGSRAGDSRAAVENSVAYAAHALPESKRPDLSALTLCSLVLSPRRSRQTRSRRDHCFAARPVLRPDHRFGVASRDSGCLASRPVQRQSGHPMPPAADCCLVSSIDRWLSASRSPRAVRGASPRVRG
jgi:hypothetical protein